MKQILTPQFALNKAFLKLKPLRLEIDHFKAQAVQLLDRIKENESEEFHKNLLADFLKKAYYEPKHFINTKGRNDLVVHIGEESSTPVGILMEVKKPTSSQEMLKVDAINTKALQELLLYYLRERITHKNLALKQIIATNIYEWFVFDVQIFEKCFAQNKDLVQKFQDFEEGRLAGKTTDFFYKEIATPYIEAEAENLEFTHFDLRNYEVILRQAKSEDDRKLIALFKVLSPEHLLKLPFANDSNTLDMQFYGELLHVLGLTEVSRGGLQLIERKPKAQRDEGSLLENTITQLETLKKLERIPDIEQYGETYEEQVFSIALELVLTWTNRILFLKLLEAQLVAYNQGDKDYEFMTLQHHQSYDTLNALFFQVLAYLPEERHICLRERYAKVPYLNSSLFEPSEIEQQTIFLSNLYSDKKMPLYERTVLKDHRGRKKQGRKNTLAYFLEFLNAYDFSSEGAQDIQEENKRLINAAVLGLIFEKINGYKEGSFFTPGFITMYMCRETIRQAVVHRFNEAKGWNCTNISELYDKIEDREEANRIVNSVRICDPSVGSGHFLVSALNEMIAIKNDLKILQDRNGWRLKEYKVIVANDELVITDENEEVFEYNPKTEECQRVQEAIFHEKQTLIENCLFGVDINPNSVKICRLRLWIELLKHAYYKTDITHGLNRGLETLPNLDINIKCGNSLISRFDINADLGQALKQSRWNIESYRHAVATYRNATNSDEKREMRRLIADIKSDFSTEITKSDPQVRKLNKLIGELNTLLQQTTAFGKTEAETQAFTKKRQKIEREIEEVQNHLDDLKTNRIYRNAFEWRFEFPEVLNEEGDFTGFDAIVGNPPYIKEYEGKQLFDGLRQNEIYQGKIDMWYLFCPRALDLLKKEGILSFIATNNWVTNAG
ncbi:MAG: Eco57I restriction-modification methylase domain-containing protein, partial [Bernardetiaceae bacterium]|nr:Eco57I restriction-modification methylase domain-containing protein [Bernardetiaceae bacterium]